MVALIVDAGESRARWHDRVFPCAIGRAGACPAMDKREGDGRSPIGAWPIRSALLRPDRELIPPPGLPWRWLRPDDGWCDDPCDPAYNRPIRHPYPGSAERLWRADDQYDAVVVLGHNDAPPSPGKGSAIFLHLRGTGPTAGCVAVGRDVMTVVLAAMTYGDVVDIRP